MPDLSELQEITRPLTVDFYGTEIAIEYRPVAMTVDLEDRLFARRRDPDKARDEIVKAFVDVIAGWDMTAGGEPIPVTEEGLRRVPTRVLWETLREAYEDQSPGKSSGSG